MFVAVMKWDNNGSIEKYQAFENRKDAEDHVEKFLDIYPDAFVHGTLMGRHSDWKVIVKGNLQKKTPVVPEASNVVSP
ncbi:MAG: hypothetical protein ACWGQW_00055 [bacterium]